MSSPQLVPCYGRGALSDVMTSVLAGLGVPDADDVLGLGAGRRTVVCLVDGLGYAALRRHADLAPFLVEHMGGRPPVTAGFPTTTVASLGSVGTGLPPGAHGLVGYQVAVPGTEGRLHNLLRWSGEVDPLEWQPRPTVFERADASGVAVTQVGPAAFKKTGFTRAALRGARYRAANSVGEWLSDAVAAAGEGDRSLVYVYLGDLDATGHRRGCTSRAWRTELAHTDGIVRRLRAALPADTDLLVTGDHGMVDVPDDARVDADTTAALRDGVAALGGEARARYVYARPGAAADVLATWAETMGDRMWVVSRDEAVAAGWFGPAVGPQVAERIGDVVAAAQGDAAVVASRTEPIESRLVGMHGSLTADELLVPLVVARG